MFNRRVFIHAGATLLAAPAIIRSQAFANQSTHLPITVSSYLLDRTQALFNGTVKIEGTDARFKQGAIGDMNTAAFSGSGQNEISELGLHPFMLAHAKVLSCVDGPGFARIDLS